MCGAWVRARHGRCSACTSTRRRASPAARCRSSCCSRAARAASASCWSRRRAAALCSRPSGRGIERRAAPAQRPRPRRGRRPAAGQCRRLGRDLVHLHTGRATGSARTRRAGPACRSARAAWTASSRADRARAGSTAVSRRVVAISGPARTQLVAGGVDPARVELIHSSVDPPTSSRWPRERRSCAPSSARARGLRTARALAALVGVRARASTCCSRPGAPAPRGVRPALWIAGEGEERANLERLAARLGLSRARFLGRREDSGELLAAADVLVLPARREGVSAACRRWRPGAR